LAHRSAAVAQVFTPSALRHSAFSPLARSSRRLATGRRCSPVIGAPRRAAALWRSASLGSTALAINRLGAPPLWRSTALAFTPRCVLALSGAHLSPVLSRLGASLRLRLDAPCLERSSVLGQFLRSASSCARQLSVRRRRLSQLVSSLWNRSSANGVFLVHVASSHEWGRSWCLNRLFAPALFSACHRSATDAMQSPALGVSGA